MFKHPASVMDNSVEPPDKKRKIEDDLWSDDDDENDLLMSQIPLDDFNCDITTVQKSTAIHTVTMTSSNSNSSMAQNGAPVSGQKENTSMYSKKSEGSFSFPDLPPWLSADEKLARSQSTQLTPNQNNPGVTSVNLSANNKKASVENRSAVEECENHTKQARD